MARVLVVDDDQSVAHLIEAVLRHAGFEVSTVLDGAHALRLLEESHFDVLLCDKNLPGVTGTQVLLTARERSQALTTVMMTASPEALGLSELGLDGYIAKPFRSTSLLIHTIASARERRAYALERRELELKLAANRALLEKHR